MHLGARVLSSMSSAFFRPVPGFLPNPLPNPSQPQQPFHLFRSHRFFCTTSSPISPLTVATSSSDRSRFSSPSSCSKSDQDENQKQRNNQVVIYEVNLCFVSFTVKQRFDHWLRAEHCHDVVATDPEGFLGYEIFQPMEVREGSVVAASQVSHSHNATSPSSTSSTSSTPISPSTSSSPSYSRTVDKSYATTVQYRLRNKAAMERYLEHGAGKMRAKAFDVFAKTDFEASRRIFEVEAAKQG